MIMSIVIDNPNILKIINKLAKTNKTSENKIMEEALEKGLEIMQINEEEECEIFHEELDKISADMEKGNRVEIDVEALFN